MKQYPVSSCQKLFIDKGNKRLIPFECQLNVYTDDRMHMAPLEGDGRYYGAQFNSALVLNPAHGVITH